MRFAIEYEHLKDELTTDNESKWHFDKVKESANKFSLELSDEEFKHFLTLRTSDKDVDWIMHKMSVYKLSFTDALISYITC